MKNKWLVNGLLAMVIAIGTICFANGNTYAVLATESPGDEVEAATPGNVDYIVEKHTDISEYRTGSYTAPSIEMTTVTGEWVFAGWFKDVECTTALGSTEEPVAGTSYYAKFVPADVLSVKCQISTGTTEESDSTLLRCISSVDSLKYSKIGFDLVTPELDENNQKIEKSMESSSVGKRIRVTEDKASNPCSYSPKVVDTESEYFYSAVETIDQDYFKQGYLVKPYWITKDGTKVYGVSRYVTVNEGINKDVIYIPVKMDQTTADETTVVTVGDSTATKVDYDADGGYAHFALSVATPALSSVTKYTVTAGDNTSTYIYRNLNTEYTGSGTDDKSWYEAYKNDNGTVEETEFVIATSADLYGLASIVNGSNPLSSKTIYVVSDITIEDGSWTMIGKNADNYFNGIFDGQGHTISGLKGSTYGMFGYTAECTIKNFQLKDSEFTANLVGSIAYAFDGTMEKVYSNATITCASAASTSIGGMIGRLTNSNVGGRTSVNSQSSISDCWFDGTISVAYSGTNDVYYGGIIGDRAAGSGHTVSNCLFTGEMTINHTTETATNVKSTNVGGILGGNGKDMCSLKTCLSAGSATVTVANADYFPKKIGAITGSATGVTIGGGNYVYATEAWENALICADTENANAINLAGTVVDTYESYINIPNLDYYTSSNKNGHWVVRENAVPALKAFEDEWIDVAWYYDNRDSNSYSIATAQELYGLSVLSQKNSFEGKTINLTDDIIMNSGKATDWAAGKNTGDARLWKPIGMPSGYGFKGMFNGNNHTISGIYCSAVGGHTGFIGQLVGGTVNNLQLSNSYFSRGGNNVGGLVAYMKGGEVNSVYCDVIVNQTSATSQNVGGLIGWAADTVSVTNSWFAGTVTSKGRYTGGIVGYVNGTANITDCLVTGKVQGDYTGSETTMYVGGILGGDDKGNWTLTRCFMAGEMSVEDSEKTGVAPLVGSVVGGNSQKTRVLTDCYTTTQDYSFFVYEPDGLAENNKVTGAESCKFVDTASKDNVPNLFVEGSITWTTDEDGNAVLNF